MFELPVQVSGIYHWIVDNYGNGSTPVLGSQIAAFQGHHQRERLCFGGRIASCLLS